MDEYIRRVKRLCIRDLKPDDRPETITEMHDRIRNGETEGPGWYIRPKTLTVS